MTTKKKHKIRSIIIPIVIFIICVVLGFGGTFIFFNMKNLISFSETTTMLLNNAGSVLYAASDGVPVYSTASLDGTVIAQLRRGDVVTFVEKYDDTFSKVITSNNVTGYVLTAQLLDEDPTYNDPTTEMTADPTPIPTTRMTETKVSIETTAVQSDRRNNNTQATTTTSEETSATSSSTRQTVEPPETETTPSLPTVPSESSTESTTDPTLAPTDSPSNQTEPPTEAPTEPAPTDPAPTEPAPTEGGNGGETGN